MAEIFQVHFNSELMAIVYILAPNLMFTLCSLFFFFPLAEIC